MSSTANGSGSDVELVVVPLPILLPSASIDLVFEPEDLAVEPLSEAKSKQTSKHSLSSKVPASNCTGAGFCVA